jgi:predicted DNA-binding ribbon-helix-helix protein
MKSTVIKRSIVLAQHKTSISLEEEFWKALKDIARAHHMALSALVLSIRRCHRGNLSSAIRVFVFEHYHTQVLAVSADRSGPFAMIPTLANHEAQAL